MKRVAFVIICFFVMTTCLAQQKKEVKRTFVPSTYRVYVNEDKMESDSACVFHLSGSRYRIHTPNIDATFRLPSRFWDAVRYCEFHINTRGSNKRTLFTIYYHDQAKRCAIATRHGLFADRRFLHVILHKYYSE